MADYDRQILIPYLRDVCCTEMLVRRLEQDISSYRKEANKFADWANRLYEDPKEPNRFDYSNNEDSAAGGAFVGVVICLIGLALIRIPILGVPVVLYGGIMVWTCISEYIERSHRANEWYEEALEEYNRKAKQNQSWRNQRPEWRATAQSWREKEEQAKSNLNDAKVMREKLYAVNIIPSRYRNIHAAYYLYDFFESCRETDLEKTIQTMLLDEIVQRMDKLIEQNEQILLNQRMMIALQEEQNRTISDNHRENMLRLAEMETNQERQLDYQRMIEANQEVTNFFLAADYIERHR